MQRKSTKSGLAAVLAMVMVLVAACATALFAAQRQGPRIYLPEGRFDLGTVEQGAVPEHIFEIRNLGDEVLEIGSVQPT